MTKTMTTPVKPVFAVKQPAPAAPFLIQFFMVQGVNFRCAAYLDLQGKWRDAVNHDELFGEIRVLE